VHFFPSASSGHFLHTRGGRSIARLVGQSAGDGGDSHDAQRFDERERHGVDKELFTIGVSPGHTMSSEVEQQVVDYLARGGCHAHEIVATGKPLAAVSGSPQGRCPDEEGPHGCLLVEVDTTGAPRPRLLATDVLRWQTAEIAINEATRPDDLESAIAECLRDFQDEAEERILLISCQIVGGVSVAQWISTTSLTAQLLASVQQRVVESEPAVWPVAISARQTDPISQAYYEQDTILGEFLRLNQRYQDDGELPLDVGVLDCEMDQQQASKLRELLKFTGKQRRQQALQKAALLGASLLGADDQQHAEATSIARPQDQEAA